MSAPLRVSAVSFLNARPLVAGLAEERALFDVEFDLPSVCAERLHAGDVDLGLIPSFEYLRGDYRLVPGIAIGSDGPILSVAVFTTVPMARVRRLALDTSSRTSVALTHILCAKRWQVTPEMVPAAPSLARCWPARMPRCSSAIPRSMSTRCRRASRRSISGRRGSELTGLPFVYAAWTGRPGALTPAHLAALAAARDRGLARARCAGGRRGRRRRRAGGDERVVSTS